MSRRPGAIHPAAQSFFLVNEGLAFVLEVVALGVLAWWGSAVALWLAVAAPLAAAALWGAFAAPKARFSVPLAAQLAVKALVFGGAALALLALGQRAAGLWFAGTVLVNTALATYYRSRHRPPYPSRS